MPDIDLRLIAAAGLDLDQYFGLWAVEDTRFLQLLAHVGQMDLAAHVRASGPLPQAAATQQVLDNSTTNIALLDINGTMTKRGSSFSAAGGSIGLRKAVRAAARDPEIGGILLRIDSPGGSVSGTQDLAREIAAANEKKPVFAFCEDLCASAAYWVASQAEAVFANNPTALVGSIGTFIGLYDYSAMAAKEGIKAITIKTGAYKGAGFMGAEITDEQKAYWQEIVDQTQTQFSAAIAAGRKMSAERVATLADGRVHAAEQALKFGLIDGIESFDGVLAALAAAISKRRTPSPSRRKSSMSEQLSSAAPETTTPATPVAATYPQLKTALPGADAAFLCAQMEQSATLDQARNAWMSEQQKRLDASAKELAEAKARAETKRPGVEALGGATKKSPAADGDAMAAFEQAVAEQMAAKKNRAAAVRAVVHAHPELHQAYVAAANAKK